MKKIVGIVTNRDNKPLSGVNVVLKNHEFRDMFSTTTNNNGEYILEADGGYYPYIFAVREYGENYLEYWGQNIYLTDNLEINMKIGKLEIYGLNCFVIKGGYPALTVYFRPMSLRKALAEEEDIAPNLVPRMISAVVNENHAKVYLLNKVQEFVGENTMTAYLMQISCPSEEREKNKNFLQLHIEDEDGDIGEASIYY